MKKNIARLTALICCAAIILSGCGGITNSTKSDGSTPSTSPDTSKAEAKSNINKEGDKIANEKITITGITGINSFVKTPIGEFEGHKLLEEATNIHWDIQGISESIYLDKLTLLISSDNLPEVVMTLPNTDIKDKYYKDNQFMPLDDLINEWAPGLKRIIDSDPAIRPNLVSADDRMYSTPSGEIAPWLDDGDEFFVNTDWLTALNLKNPTTLDEFYTMLKAFKENDPNGNKLKDEIPMTFNMKGGQLMRFMGMFGLPINDKYEMQRDKKYVFGPTQEEFRKCLDYFHKLYAEGLLDPESLTQEKPEMMAKGAADPTILGVLTGFWANDYCPPEISKKYISVPPLKGGKEGEPEWLGSVNLPGAQGMAITKNCKNPEAAIRWADYISADAFRAFGIVNEPIGDDKPYYVGEDGKYYENNAKVPSGLTLNEWSYSTTLRHSIPFCILGEENLKIRGMDKGGDIDNKLNLIEVYRPYFYAEPLTSAHFSYYKTDEDRQNVVTIQTDLKAIVQEFLAQSLMNGITDDSWATFQETLKKAKIDRLIEARQYSLDTYYSKFS